MRESPGLVGAHPCGARGEGAPSGLACPGMGAQGRDHVESRDKQDGRLECRGLGVGRQADPPPP